MSRNQKKKADKEKYIENRKKKIELDNLMRE
jgi:hypothetical protein